MTRPSIDVVLCTYNGERFLGQQLQSLETQTLPPDRVLALDDASTDGTAALLDEWAATAPFAVEVIRQPTNLGYRRNFEDGLSRSSGDLVALCDQDDIWLPHKLANAASTFAERPEIGMIFTQGSLIDEAGERVEGTLWERVGKTPPLIRQINRGSRRPFLWGAVATGCTMVMTQTVVRAALPFPTSLGTEEFRLSHDGWLAAVAAYMGPVFGDARVSLQYRLHGQQQVGVPRAGELDWDRHLKAAIRDRIASLTGDVSAAWTYLDVPVQFAAELTRHFQQRSNNSAEIIDALSRVSRSLHLRETLRSEPAGRRWRHIISNLLNDGYSPGLTGVVEALVDL